MGEKRKRPPVEGGRGASSDHEGAARIARPPAARKGGEDLFGELPEQPTVGDKQGGGVPLDEKPPPEAERLAEAGEADEPAPATALLDEAGLTDAVTLWRDLAANGAPPLARDEGRGLAAKLRPVLIGEDLPSVPDGCDYEAALAWAAKGEDLGSVARRLVAADGLGASGAEREREAVDADAIEEPPGQGGDGDRIAARLEGMGLPANFFEALKADHSVLVAHEKAIAALLAPERKADRLWLRQVAKERVPRFPIREFDALWTRPPGEGAGEKIAAWEPPEPWGWRVNLAALLDDMGAIVTRYVHLAPAKADTAALWAAMTWLHDRLHHSPFLNVTSATKRCGKSALLEVLGAFVHHPRRIDGAVTDAMLRRLVDAGDDAPPTLLMDEIDTYLPDAEQLRGAVNGSERRGATIPVLVPNGANGWDVVEMPTFCPKALSGIEGLADTTRDRCIRLVMERRPPGGDNLSWNSGRREPLADMRRKLMRWRNDAADAVAEVAMSGRDDERAFFPAPLWPNDRQMNAWAPLLAIADAAGGDWPARARTAAVGLLPDDGDNDSFGEMLLADLHAVFEAAGMPDVMPTGKAGDGGGGFEGMKPEAILPALVAMEERAWGEWGRARKPITPRGLARLLAPFGVAPGSVRLRSGATPKGYRRERLEPVWRRYGIPSRPTPPDLSATTPQPAGNREKSQSLSATREKAVADREARNVRRGKACGVVADKEPPVDGKGANGAAADTFHPAFAREVISRGERPQATAKQRRNAAMMRTAWAGGRVTDPATGKPVQVPAP